MIRVFSSKAANSTSPQRFGSAVCSDMNGPEVTTSSNELSASKHRLHRAASPAKRRSTMIPMYKVRADIDPARALSSPTPGDRADVQYSRERSLVSSITRSNSSMSSSLSRCKRSACFSLFENQEPKTFATQKPMPLARTVSRKPREATHLTWRGVAGWRTSLVLLLEARSMCAWIIGTNRPYPGSRATNLKAFLI